MATGKTTGRYVKILLDDSGGTPRDISTSVSTIGGVGLNNEQVDVTTLSDSVMQYLSGRGDSTIELGGPFNNTATTGAHGVLSGLVGGNTAATLTVQIGIRAAATTGDPEWEGEYVVTAYTVNVGTNDVSWSATLKPAFGASTPAWGTV